MKPVSGLILLIALGTLSSIPSVNGQTRDEKVRNDREQVAEDGTWYYDDLRKGLEAAAQSKKPLMVVLRCIP